MNLNAVSVPKAGSVVTFEGAIYRGGLGLLPRLPGEGSNVASTAAGR